ncbi:MAG: hypothetical protein ACHREM_20275, partial [Polyangiales bacterium]
SGLDIAVEGSYGGGFVGGQDFLLADLAAIARVGVGAFGVASTMSAGLSGGSAGASALGGFRVPLGRFFVASALGEIGARQRTYAPALLADALFGAAPSSATATLPYVGTRTSITFRTPGTLGFELGATMLAGDDVGRVQTNIGGSPSTIGGFTFALMAHVGIALDGGVKL